MGKLAILYGSLALTILGSAFLWVAVRLDHEITTPIVVQDRSQFVVQKEEGGPSLTSSNAPNSNAVSRSNERHLPNAQGIRMPADPKYQSFSKDFAQIAARDSAAALKDVQAQIDQLGPGRWSEKTPWVALLLQLEDQKPQVAEFAFRELSTNSTLTLALSGVPKGEAAESSYPYQEYLWNLSALYLESSEPKDSAMGLAQIIARQTDPMLKEKLVEQYAGRFPDEAPMLFRELAARGVHLNLPESVEQRMPASMDPGKVYEDAGNLTE